MQGFFNIRKPIHVIHYINKLKGKNHMIISNDAEKAADKTQHSFLIKTQRSRNRRNFFIMIKNIIILRANIILKDKRLNAFFLRSRTRKRWLLLPLLFNMVLEVLAGSVKKEKELKDYEIKKENIYLCCIWHESLT